MKKVKSLNKKIRRLKERLEKDAKKLAKLTMKLGTAVTKSARTKSRKGSKTSESKEPAARSAPAAKRSRPSAQAPARTGVVSAKASRGRSTKKKLNISPERRAQLAAAMKARWAAKKAASGAKGARPSDNEEAAQGNRSQL